MINKNKISRKKFLELSLGLIILSVFGLNFSNQEDKINTKKELPKGYGSIGYGS